MKRLLLLLAVFLIVTHSVSAQTNVEQILRETNVEWLKDFAERQNALALEEFRIAAEKALREGWPIRTEGANGEVIQLIRLDENGAPVYMKTDNTTSQTIIKTDQIQAGPYNLTGAGITIREWDGGNVRATHENLTPPARVTNLDGAALSDHATHVAGTMIGDGSGNATAEGMAPAALIRAFDFFNDQTEMATEAAAGALLSNHSYGFISGWYFSGGWHWYGDPTVNTNESHHFGWYSATTAAYDAIAYNAPFYLMVKSAGNDRGDNGSNPHSHNGAGVFTDFHPADCNQGAGYDCLEFFGTAKNDLTVGAIDDASAMSSFSSWGPIDDGRLGVDIVANGVTLTSSVASADNAYASMSGTSMSAPSVTGSLALLQQRYQNTHGAASMRSATAKALVCHTADDLGNAGPDYQFGYGRMNSLKAVQTIDADVTLATTMQENTLTNFGTYSLQVFATGGGTPLEATICWTDPAGTGEGPGHDISTIKLVNDLDLRMTNGTTTFFPYVLDPSNPGNPAGTGDNIRDNMEKIRIPAPTAGSSYTLTVTHKGSLSAPQAYSLIITGINSGCTPPTVNAGPDRVICLGSSAVIGGTPTATGGTAPYSYVWTPSAGLSNAFISNPTASPAATTTYTVTVTDALGCSASDAVLVTVNPVPTANAGPDRAICTGSSTAIGGSPTASGGTAPYTYSWVPTTGLSSPTVANPTANPPATTDYTVTVTDANGCQATDVMKLTVNPTPTVSAGPDKTVCENAQPTPIGGTPTATGGTGPYTYSWSPTTGLSAANVPNPDATQSPGVYTYTVTVSDANGCGGSDAMILTVNANPDPIITANPDDTICYGATTQLCATNVMLGINGNATAPFNSNNGQAGNNFDLIAGPNPITITGWDLNLDPGSWNVSMYYKVGTYQGFETNPAPWVLLGNITVNGVGVNLPTPYPVGGLTIPAGQTYGFYVICTNGTGINYTNGILTYSVYAGNADVSIAGGKGRGLPLFTGGQFTPRLWNGRVYYSIPGATVLWSTGATTQCINVSPPTATSYWVTATNTTTGCQGQDTIDIHVWPQLFADAGQDHDYCENSGTIVNIGGSPTGSGGIPPYTYSWSPTANLSCTTCPNPDANPNVTTNYTVTVTDIEGCTATDVVQVLVHPLPVVDIKITQGADSICFGDTITLEATVAGFFGPNIQLLTTTSGTNGQNGAMFDIEAKPGNNVNIVSFEGVAFAAATANMAIYAKTGTHVGFETNPAAWTLVGTANNVVMPAPPTLFQIPIPVNWVIPAGTRAAFYVTTTTAGTNIRYSNGTGVGNIFVQDPNIIFYEGVGKAYPFGGTFAPRVWNGRITYNLPVPPPNYDYLWSTGDTTSTITFIPTSTDQYWVAVTDNFGCTGYDTIGVWVNQEIVLDAQDQAICLWDAVTLGGSPTASGGSGLFQYQWSPNVNLSCVSCPNPVANPAFTTQYLLEVTDSFGCMVSQPVLVTVNPNPEADAGGPQSICPGDVATIGGSPSAINGTPPYSYAWSPATGLSSATVANPDASPAVSTWYYLTVTDANGCSDWDSVLVVVYPEPDPTIQTIGPYCVNAGIQQLMAATSGGTWSGPGIVNSSTGDFDPAVAGPGLHQIVYEVVSFVGCYASDTVMIEVFALTPVMITSGIDYCTNQGNVFLTALPSGGWWSGSGIVDPNTGEFDPLFAGLGTHAIVYAYTDANGCTNSDTTYVNVHPNPDASITPAGPFCENDPAVQLVAATAGGTWSGAGTTPSGLFTPASAGPGFHTIVYDITDVNGCFSSDTIVIEVKAAPAAAINPSSPFCENTSNVILVGTPASGTNYWSGPGVINPLTGEWSPSSAGPGTHTITLTKTYSNGCVSVATTTVVVYAAPDATINPVPPQCSDGAPITLTAATAGGQWSGPGITNASAGTFDPVVAGPGVHIVQYVVTDLNGCSDMDTTEVKVADPLVITGTTTDVLCQGDQDGSVDINVNGGTPPYVYAWSTTATSQDLYDVGAGTYTVTVTDNIGCSASATFVVNEPTAVYLIDTMINPATAPSYNNGSIDATFGGGTPPYDFVWSNGATTEDIDGLQADEYRVTVIDAHGCRYNFFITVPEVFPLGTDPAAYDNGLKVFPVPTDGQLTVELKLPGTQVIALSLFDALGREMYTWVEQATGPYQHKIDMDGMAAGNYVLRVGIGSHTVSRTVVLAR